MEQGDGGGEGRDGSVVFKINQTAADSKNENIPIVVGVPDVEPSWKDKSDSMDAVLVPSTMVAETQTDVHVEPIATQGIVRR